MTMGIVKCYIDKFHNSGDVFHFLLYDLCYDVSDKPLVIEILWYRNSKAIFWCPTIRFNGDIPF